VGEFELRGEGGARPSLKFLKLFEIDRGILVNWQTSLKLTVNCYMYVKRPGAPSFPRSWIRGLWCSVPSFPRSWIRGLLMQRPLFPQILDPRPLMQRPLFHQILDPRPLDAASVSINLIVRSFTSRFRLHLLLLLLQCSLLPGVIVLQGVLLLQGSMSVFACHYGWVPIGVIGCFTEFTDHVQFCSHWNFGSGSR
jgi:hypothetical protein